MNRSHTGKPSPLLLVALPVVALLIGVAAGWWFSHDSSVPATDSMESAAPAEPEVLYWYDPMVPNQHFDKPGKSPFMDMDLVPKYADEGGSGDDDGIRIDPRLTQNLGVRTEELSRGQLEDEIEAIGVVAFNDDRLQRVSAPADAILERLYRRGDLTPVTQGEPLAKLLAPTWVSAQAEYLSLRRLGEGPNADGTASLRAAARQRLRVLGMPESAIRRLESAGEADGSVTLYAPTGGVIRSLQAAEGDNLRRGDPLLSINPLDTVWVDVELDAADAARLGEASSAALRMDALPDRRFDARVQALLPAVDGSSRRRRLRLIADNPGGLLAPGQFARVSLEGEARRGLLLPNEALIATGRRRAVVVSDGDGRFRVVDVRIGASDDRHTLVLDGLSVGDRVVTSGQFLIDSEASLRQQVQRLDETDEPADAMDHSSMDHSSMDHSSTNGGSTNNRSMDAGSMDAGSMDHGAMNHGEMDHSTMDHGTMNDEPMDHGSMDHDEHGGSQQP